MIFRKRDDLIDQRHGLGQPAVLGEPVQPDLGQSACGVQGFKPFGTTGLEQGAEDPAGVIQLFLDHPIRQFLLLVR